MDSSTSQDPSDQDFFNVLKYTADCGNLWFRELYKFGVLIPSVNGAAVAPMAWGLTEARIIITHPFGYLLFFGWENKTPLCVYVPKEGYGSLASMSASRSWVLYRIRPKLHMHEHVVRLGSFMLSEFMKCVHAFMVSNK